MKINNFLFYLIATPVFFSFTGELVPVLDRGVAAFDERMFSFSFSVGFVSFLYFSVFSIIRGNLNTLFLILVSVIIGLFGYLLSRKPQYALVLQFWILMSILPVIFKNYCYLDLRKLSINVCYLILLIQSLSLINSLSGDYGAVIPNFIYIYNYEQYFSFAVLIGLYFAVHFGGSKKFIVFYYLVAFLGAVDADNLSAIYFLMLFPVILIVRFASNKYSVASDIKLLVSLFTILIIAGLPIYIEFLYLFAPSLFDQGALGGRGSSYTEHFRNFDLISLFFPKLFYANIPHDPHNTYLTLGVSLGYLVALIVMFTIVLYLKSLRFSHLAFVAPFVVITFSLTEPLQHQYTANLFAFMFCVLLRASKLENVDHVSKNFKLLNNEKYKTCI